MGVAVIVTMALLTLSAPQRGWLWWVFTSAAVLVFLLMAINRLLLPTITGWSLGRALFGIAVGSATVRPSGSCDWPRVTSRICWTPPLCSSDGCGRCGTAAGARSPICCCAPRCTRSSGRSATCAARAAVALVAATLLCAAGVGLSYLVVYRHDRAVDAARAQIAAEGPRIVEQMLSYDVDTLQQDFSHAQSLTTDAYRPQLIAQQQAVQKAGATKNEYWAVSSAVLSDAAGDRRPHVDVAGDAGPARHRPQGSEVHHRDGAGGLRQVTRRAVARRESHRAEEAADESGRPVSPRRKVEADEADFFDVAPKPPRRWGLPIIAALATLLIAAAITGKHADAERPQQGSDASAKEVEALGYVRGFMTAYTTLDPFHANDYADRILAQGTGDFAKMFKEKQNEILIQVARAEPTTGTVLEAGVQRWNDNGSADVLVATKIATKSPDGKSTIESGNRWVATAIKEGQQWKISQLIQVI